MTKLICMHTLEKHTLIFLIGYMHTLQLLLYLVMYLVIIFFSKIS